MNRLLGLFGVVAGGLIIGGITGMVVVYGRVGQVETASTALRRDVDRLEASTRDTREWITRLDERSHSGRCQTGPP